MDRRGTRSVSYRSTATRALSVARAFPIPPQPASPPYHHHLPARSLYTITASPPYIRARTRCVDVQWPARDTQRTVLEILPAQTHPTIREFQST